MPVLWLVTKNEAQLDVVRTWDKHFGRYHAAGDYLDEGLSVLTYATATKRDLSHYGLVIADEVHRAAADTYYDAIQGATNAWYRLGLTGTPKGRSDGKEIFIEGGIGPVCYTVSRQLLIERSLCSSGVTRRVIMDDDMYIDGGHGNWTQIERVGIVENLKRDTLLLMAAKDLRHGDSLHDQILILCRRQAHAEALAKNASVMFGYPVKAMHSRRSKKERKTAYEDFASGKTRIIVATGIYDDSMTFPHLKILVNAAGGKSTILTGQRLGRVLAGDKKVTIIDCSDEHYETLRGHAKKRMRVYEKEGYPVTDWRIKT
jgi:superfamily II DNA or RNA helicase